MRRGKHWPEQRLAGTTITIFWSHDVLKHWDSNRWNENMTSPWAMAADATQWVAKEDAKER